MRDVHCCQVPTAAMEMQYVAFHHPLHSNCYWCIAPKQVPKAAVPLQWKLRHLHCYCIVCYIVQCWLFCFMVFPVRGKRGEKNVNTQAGQKNQNNMRKAWYKNIVKITCFCIQNINIALDRRLVKDPKGHLVQSPTNVEMASLRTSRTFSSSPAQNKFWK